MNKITIICEHTNKDTIEHLKNIIAYAKKNKYKFINPDNLNQFFNDKLGGEYLLLTFDDGQEYKYEGIAEFLREHRIKAISFVIPLHWGFHSLYTNFDYYIRNKDVFELGSHTLTHTMIVKNMNGTIDLTCPKLIYYENKNLKADYTYGLIDKEFNIFKNRIETDEEYNNRLNIELNFSKEWIERATGAECRFFAYPYGVFNDYVENRVRESRYKMAFTINRTSNNLMTIPRIDYNNLGEKTKDNIINDVKVVSLTKYYQSKNDVKLGIYK